MGRTARRKSVVIAAAVALVAIPAIATFAQDVSSPYFRFNRGPGASVSLTPPGVDPDFVPGTGTLAVYGPLLLRSKVGALASTTFVAPGAVAPITWESVATAVPAGFGRTGPTVSGSWSYVGRVEGVVLKATDAQGRVGYSQPLAVESYDDPPPATVSLDQSAYGGKKDASFSTGAPGTTVPPPVSWGLAPGSQPLPAGLSVDPGSGVVSGKPTVGGTYPGIVVQASNGSTVATSEPTTISLAVASISYAFSPMTERQTVNVQPSRTEIAAPATYELDGASSPLPQGLALSPTTGAITGAPTTAVTVSNLRVKVTDADGAVATAGPYSLVVNAAPDQTADLSLPSTARWSAGDAQYTTDSRLNVTYLVGQTVPAGRPIIAPGQSVEITCAGPTKVNGIYVGGAYPTPTIRVEANYGSGWTPVSQNVTKIGDSTFQTTSNAARYRVVNMGSQDARTSYGLMFNGKYAQLPVLTYQSMAAQLGTSFDRVYVGDSANLPADLYTGAMGYGSIVTKAPYTYALTTPIAHANGPDYTNLPSGLSLNPSTGTISGTAEAVTWTPVSNYVVTQRSVYPAATDADGYTVFSNGVGFTVNARPSAAVQRPTSVTVNGAALSGEDLAKLLDGTLNLTLPTNGATILATYPQSVSLNNVKVTLTRDMNLALAVSNNGGSNWLAPTVTKTGTATATLATSQVVTANVVSVRTSGGNMHSLKGLSVGRDGSYPAAPFFTYTNVDTLYSIMLGESFDMNPSFGNFVGGVTFTLTENVSGPLPTGVQLNPSTARFDGTAGSIQTRRYYYVLATDSEGYAVRTGAFLSVHTPNTTDFGVASARIVTASGATRETIANPASVMSGTAGWSLASNEILELTFSQPVQSSTFLSKTTNGRQYYLEVWEGAYWWSISGLTTGTSGFQKFGPSASTRSSFTKMRLRSNFSAHYTEGFRPYE